MKFEFESPIYFIALILPLAWAILLWYWKEQHGKRLFAWNPLEFPRKTKKSYSRKEIFLLAGFLFCILGLVNPRIGSGMEETKIESSDVYIALDISHSMNARDISPSRLERAKKWAESLIQSQKGNRIGLVFFAGNAYLQMPLSFDFASALMYVKSAKTELAPTQGSSIADAIDLVFTLHQEDKKTQKTMVIISDGEEHEIEAKDAAKKLHKNGWSIFTIATGTETGSEIPIIAEGIEDLAREEDGSLAISKLHWQTLKSIAEAGGGRAYDIRNGKNAVSDINDKMFSIRQEMSEVKSYREYTPFYPIFMALAILCFLIAFDILPVFRKKFLASTCILLCAIPLWSQSAHTLLRNGDVLYQDNKYAEAAQQYLKAAEKEPSYNAYYNLGNSFYNLQKYAEAQKAYEKALEYVDSHENAAKLYHNLGNALFKQKQYSPSVDAYKKSLQENPLDKETVENLLKARKLAKQQQQQQQQKNQQDQQQKDKDQNANQDQNQNQNPPKSSDDKNEKEMNPNQAPLTREEAEKLMEIIENEDKKVNKKIRRGSSRPTKPTKPW